MHSMVRVFLFKGGSIFECDDLNTGKSIVLSKQEGPVLRVLERTCPRLVVNQPSQTH